MDDEAYNQFERALVAEGEETALALLPLRDGADLATGVDFRPCATLLREISDFGAIAELRRLLPFADDLEIGHLFESTQDGLIFSVVDLLPAGVIAATLHVADLQRTLEVLLQVRETLDEKRLIA